MASRLQPTIRLKPKDGSARATITPEFIEQIELIKNDLIAMKKAKIASLKRELENLDGFYRTQKEKDIEELTWSIQELRMDGRSNGRGGLEYDKARLSRLPYDLYTVKERVSPQDEKQVWLIGRTKEVISEFTYRNRKYKVNQGRYLVAVRKSCLGTTSPNVHFIPERNPTAIYRHMHHVVHHNSPTSGNPLDYRVNTCWGSFAGIAHSMVESGDIPELFRVLYMYVHRLNRQSPLATNIDHYEEIVE